MVAYGCDVVSNLMLKEEAEAKVWRLGSTLIGPFVLLQIYVSE